MYLDIYAEWTMALQASYLLISAYFFSPFQPIMCQKYSNVSYSDVCFIMHFCHVEI